MKQKIKSILAIVMILCMLFTVVGCGGTDTNSDPVAAGDDFFTDTLTENEGNATDGNTTDGASGTQSSTSSGSDGKITTNTIPKENQVGGKSWKEVLASMPSKLRGTKLVMYNWNPAAEYTGAPEVIAKFTQQTGIKVEWRTIDYSSYFTKLSALVASGQNIPDVVRTRGPLPTRMLDFQPLSNINYDFSDEAWDKQIMDLYTIKGKSYATSLKNTHVGGVYLMLYNKAQIEKYDFEDPYQLWKSGKWTFNKFVEMCKEYREVNTSGRGASGEPHMKAYLNMFGIQGAVSFDGTKYVSNFGDNKFLEVMQTLGDLYNTDKYIRMGGSTDFDSGKRLFCLSPAVTLRRKNSYFGTLKNEGNIYAVPCPAIDGQKEYYQSFGEGEAYAIAKGASNPEAVPYFLRFFLDGANYELSTYYCNEQNLEVYNWCMNQKNMIYPYEFPSSMTGDGEAGIQTKTGAQMKSFIDANAGVVDQMVKEYNDTLKKFN